MRSCAVPPWTLLVCAVAALAQFVPAIGADLIYDRFAIESGQWWRLLSGSLVHLSMRHCVYDGLALLVVGSVAEQRGGRDLGILYLVAGLAVGLAIFLWEPQITTFGGLSGIVTATLVYLCLTGCFEGGKLRWLWGGALLLAAVKLALEFWLRASWLVASGDEHFVAVPASHLAGAGMAVLLYAVKSSMLRQMDATSGLRGIRRLRTGGV